MNALAPLGVEITTPMGAAAARARELGGATVTVEDGGTCDLTVILAGLPGAGCDWWALASRYDPTTGTQVMREAVCDAPFDALLAATQHERSAETAAWMTELAVQAGAF